MINKKECIAMLLAGGQGSRLYALTQKVAKPAVPFGGKYRIIDFTLSNCVNSGLDTVGVLTQYQPLILNDYIGTGQPWDLDRIHGGVHILSPFQTSEGASWYAGTANAIFQNISFIESYDPEYLLVLSGDHIYKMDYSKMIEYHKQKKADATIAVLTVPIEQASRFGIMNTTDDGAIFEFEEKPQNPKNNLASMGVYVFNWQKLKKYLELDQSDETSSHDFGKNIIPKMLLENEKLFAFKFEGYWKDVGTIQSLWEANMDLINPNVPIELFDLSWKIYSKNYVQPPQYVSESALVQNSMITEGCNIFGDVSFSIIGAGVTIEKGAEVRNSIVMPGSHIKKGSVIQYAIIGENVKVGNDCIIGQQPDNNEGGGNLDIAVIGPNYIVADKSFISAKEIVQVE